MTELFGNPEQLPLPEPLIGFRWPKVPVYSEAQMRAYALAARRAALEEAADICDQHASCEGIAERCAAAIRALGQP